MGAGAHAPLPFRGHVDVTRLAGASVVVDAVETGRDDLSMRRVRVHRAVACLLYVLGFRSTARRIPFALVCRVDSGNSLVCTASASSTDRICR